MRNAKANANSVRAIAKSYLYGKKEWTMEAIAKALNVSHKTISGDLREFVPKVQTKRPQGGRPKSKPPRKNESISAEAMAAEKLADKPGRKVGSNDDMIIKGTRGSTSSAYLAARIKRDHPESIAHRNRAGADRWW